ncbi:MAG TPA: NAD(P)H-hydrate dehydratase [Solirubrobacteraceae bacterium]
MNLPDWLSPLPDAPSMREVDRWAIEERDIEGISLMERAGAGVVKALEKIAGEGRVAVVCGKGNNGGDGLVVARLLRNADRTVEVFCVAPPEEYSGDARTNLERLPGAGPLRLDGSQWRKKDTGERREALDGNPLAGTAVIVDAILGTGFEGEPHGAPGEAIDLVNAAGVPVLSVDVPSGVDASTGVVAGRAVTAAVTVTFHAAKPGLWIRPGKAHAGEIQRIGIGVPRGAPLEASVGLIEASILHCLPKREASGTKFTSGHVLVVGGSPGLTGAPKMTAMAAMRTGAGYVTACVPRSLQPIIASGATPELMSRGMADADGAMVLDAVAGVLDASERGGSMALGPGLGRSEGAQAFAQRVAHEATVAIVIDADGLNAYAGQLGRLGSRQAPTILTPHAGELGRLLGLDSHEIERARLEHVRAAAELAGAIVVLKGDDTLIADPSGMVAVSPGASPALATAGTGDVLTGVIAAFLAQGLEPFTAAAAGVWLHAEAGRRAAVRVGAVEGVIASDVIAALPSARSPTRRRSTRTTRAEPRR